MKTQLQIGFAVLVLMGIVLGASFFTQYTKPSEEVSSSPPPLPDGQENKLLLKFDRLVSDWRKDIRLSLGPETDVEKYIKPVEVGQKYAYVFWVHNAHDVPVTMFVKSVSCNCTDMDCAVFSPDAWSAFQRQFALSATIDRLVPFNPLSPAMVATLLESAKWGKMAGVLSKPPLPELLPFKKNGPPGMIRANFQPQHLSTGSTGETVRVSISGQIPGDVSSVTDVQIKFAAVPDLGYLPQTLDMGEITAGGKSSRDLLVWTVTRSKFEPTLKLLGLDGAEIDDPRFELGKSEELSPNEVAGLAEMLAKSVKITNKAYGRSLSVTVHEQRNGQRLDIGPFQRTLWLRSENSPEPYRVVLTAIVRGEVRLFGGDDRDRIALGSFHRGVKRTVNLESDRGVDLEIDQKATSSLFKSVLTKQEPTADGKNRWQLLVEIPDDSIAGELVPGTAVVLQLKGSPRKMRIPVTGTAAR